METRKNTVLVSSEGVVLREFISSIIIWPGDESRRDVICALVYCRVSSLLGEIFLQELWFFSLLKNQHI